MSNRIPPGSADSKIDMPTGNKELDPEPDTGRVAKVHVIGSDGLDEKQVDGQNHYHDHNHVLHRASDDATTSITTTSATNGPQKLIVQDRGLTAWLQVAGAFFLCFNSWGILNTFGAFQNYYEAGSLFAETSSNISWIGSIQAACVLLVSTIIGPIFDRGHFRILLIIGTLGVVVGHMMLSLCTEFWQVVLAQGFTVGIGGGCLFVPGQAILPMYFQRRLGLALGVSNAGSSIGGIIYPIVFHRLLTQIGFAWSVRVLGFIALVTQLVPILVMQQTVRPVKPRDIIDWTAFREPPFVVFGLAVAIGFIGLYIELFYVPFYAAQQQITSIEFSFYLVAISGAGSVFGRIFPNWASDKVGPLNVMIPGVLFIGVMLFCIQAVSSVGGMVVTTLLFGFFSGVFVALPMVIVVSLSPHKKEVLGTRMGMICACQVCGVLVGGPGAGAILGEGTNLRWTAVWCFGGAVSIGSALVFVLTRWLVAGFAIMKKA